MLYFWWENYLETSAGSGNKEWWRKERLPWATITYHHPDMSKISTKETFSQKN